MEASSLPVLLEAAAASSLDVELAPLLFDEEAPASSLAAAGA
jgi:hypothetical protein